MIRTQQMRQVVSVAEVRHAVQQAQRADDVIGFVPTMGALHEGHLSLVDASLSECDHTVVSIFVNPTQFGPQEDLSKYPRPLERDLELLAERGVWLAFVPTVEDVYPDGFDSFVDVGEIALPWEGAARPIHFRGVATVVLKLFQMVPADRAYFGQKDYQQSLVIRQLVADFNLPIELSICPIVREKDGLAMSSRNAYLSEAERRRATALRGALLLAEKSYESGETSAVAIKNAMREFLAQAGVNTIDYIAVLEEGTVREVEAVTGPVIVALAARVGQTRLIDNHRIG